MNLASHQLLMLLQWTDSAFPTGAFAHSGGLEMYTQAEIVQTAADLARLIEVKIASAASTDFIITHEAMAAGSDFARLAELDELCAVSKFAQETRDASEKIGRRMLDSVLNVLPDERLRQYQVEIKAGRVAGHHAVVHGLACGVLEIEPRDALLAFGYGLVANQTSASLKLMSIGQTQAQAVIGAVQGVLAAAVEDALTKTLADFGSFAPGLEIRAMQHAALFRRLFIS